MSSSDSLPAESFGHLRALLNYASNNRGNESSIYGAVSSILTLFCTGARVTATKFENLYLGSFPQKDLKSTSEKNYRAPDFTVLIIQSDFGQQSTDRKIGDLGPLIWEVKAGTDLESLSWFGKGRSEPLDLLQHFSPHFRQIVAQAVYAKAKFNQKPVYILLSIDVWFVLLYFPGDPLSVLWTTRKDDRSRSYFENYRKFYKYIAVPPAPIVNEECTAFSPEFLYALQLSVKDLTDVTVTPHPLFCAPEGIAELVAAQLKEQRLPEKFEERARHAEIDNRFALGEEDSDERSAGWSAAEETETEVEDQENHDGASRSPVQTRSQTAAQRLCNGRKASTQPGPSRTKKAPMVDPMSVRRSKRLKGRRKVAEKTSGDNKDGAPVLDTTD